MVMRCNSGQPFSFLILSYIMLLSLLPEEAAFESGNELPWQDYKGLRRSRYAGG